MKRKFILTLVIMAFGLAMKAQDTLLLNSTWSDSARYYILQLKDGALVFRLHSRSKAIEQLNKAGNYPDANNIMKTQWEENLEIVQAFRSNFMFCKVYFFYADSTDAWLKGKHSGFLLNDSLKIDPSIELQEKFSLLAEKGTPQKQLHYDPTQPQNEQTESGYLDETIVIYDPNHRMLKSPFPFYAKEPFPQNFFGKSWKAKVESLNKKLNNFYKINSGQQ